jgi:hypothetical protein
VRRLKTFLQLDLGDKAAFGRAWSCLVAAKLGIRFLGLRRTLDLLLPESAPVRPGAPWPRAARWLPTAIRYCPNGGHCLGRSVALHVLLRRDGVPSELRIGVRRGQASPEAHAWVEVDRVPVNDARDVAQHYKVFGTADRPP